METMEYSQQPQFGAPVPALYSLQPGPDDRCLDLVFVLDVTGSMQSYIDSATDNIKTICDEIVLSDNLASAECLRIGLIAYRDYPPQDSSFITKVFPLTSSVSQIKENLKTLHASGGGDGPEASEAAIGELLNLDWRINASKMAVLITDAPPHGINEISDGFPRGSPNGLDPLVITRQLASQGIALFVVACEPGLSGYQYGVEFYRALTEISSAMLLPLTTANLLAHVIVGSALEHMHMDRLIREVGQAVAERVAMSGGAAAVDDVAKELHERLMLRNENTRHLVLDDDIYNESEEAKHNFNVWITSATLEEARPNLKKIISRTRLSDKYLKYRSMSSKMSHFMPPRPRLGGSTEGEPMTGTGPSVGVHDTVSTPTAPIATGASPSTSPASRKITTTFKPYSAPSNMSISSYQETPSLPTTTSSSGLRDSNDDTKEEADDDDELQKVTSLFGAISIKQAQRITNSSVFRAQGMAS